MEQILSPYFVDAGNSRVKVAFFDEDGWTHAFSGDYTTEQNWKVDLLKSDRDIVFTSVSDLFDGWVASLDPDLLPRFQKIGAAEIPAHRLDYETPHTLGTDRWLACAGAFALCRQAVAVCTAGTALTVDIMDQYGVFRGGIIMPGIDAIEAAAHQAASRLPYANVLNPVKAPARNTDDAVDAGARYLIRSAVNQILSEYEADFGLIRIFVAGGGASDLAELIHRDTRSETTLIFRGMKEVFEMQRQNDR